MPFSSWLSRASPRKIESLGNPDLTHTNTMKTMPPELVARSYSFSDGMQAYLELDRSSRLASDWEACEGVILLVLRDVYGALGPHASEVARCLLAEFTNSRASLLCAAVCFGTVDIVADVASLVPNIDAPGPEIEYYDVPLGTTALMHAARCSLPEVVRALLDLGADPNAVDAEGSTALMLVGCDVDEDGPAASQVVQQGVEVARLLMDRGAVIDAVDADGRTALKLAAERENACLVEVLLAAGAQA